MNTPLRTATPLPKPGWVVYLRTSSDENQHPELSRERQRTMIALNVLAVSDLPVCGEYIDVLTGKDPHVIVEHWEPLVSTEDFETGLAILERLERDGMGECAS